MKHAHSRMPGWIERNRRIVAGNLTSSQNLQGINRQALPTHITLSADSVSGNGDDELMNFLEEDVIDSLILKPHPWKILITDDDSNVHDTTVLALSGVKIHNRPLEFLHAYSASEARELLLRHEDIALVLLDVVMETVDAGLKLVEQIRNEFHNHQLRIILRTGQPGYAPEEQISQQLAIDGYTTKSKLTRSLLISVLRETLTEPDDPPVLPN